MAGYTWKLVTVIKFNNGTEALAMAGNTRLTGSRRSLVQDSGMRRIIQSRPGRSSRRSLVPNSAGRFQQHQPPKHEFHNETLHPCHETPCPRQLLRALKYRPVHLRCLLLCWMVLAGCSLDILTGSNASTLFAQADDSHTRQVERDVEQILDEYDPEESQEDPEVLIRRIGELAANPLNVNRATEEELMGVPGMTLRLAGAIVDHRKNVKPFESAEDLTAVRGIGAVTRDRFLPYLSTGSRSELRRDLYLNPSAWIHNSRTEFYTRYRRILDEQDGYSIPDSLGGYVGNPVNYYQRLHYRSDHLSVNVTQMKRPGEPLKAPLGFDNQTFHASLQQLGRLQILVAGDYSLRFGQGLIMGSGVSLGKGQDVIRAVSRGGTAVRGHTSSSQGSAFRGIAVTWGEQMEVTGFYSGRRTTASVVGGDTIRFPAATPYHRTLSERERSLNTRQRTAGGRVNLQLPNGSLGINGWFNRFDRPVRNGNQPWQQHDFEGTDASAASLDYRVRAGFVYLYGEAGRTTGGTGSRPAGETQSAEDGKSQDTGAYGILLGLETSAGDNTEVAVAWRHYNPQFQSLFGSSFAEQSGSPRNEEGWYLGVRHSLSETVKISAYFDQYRFPAPRFRMRRPSLGFDWLGMIEYRPLRTTELYLQVRQKKQEREYASEDSFGRNIYALSYHNRLFSRLHFSMQITPRIRIRNRIEWVRVQPPGGEIETGYLLYQDIRFQARRNLQIDARITHFDTGGFESRLYHFENDLLYVFSSTMLFDQGQRLYILFNYQPAEWIQIWLKASTTIYENRTVISSGLNRLPQNYRNDIGMQVRIRF